MSRFDHDHFGEPIKISKRPLLTLIILIGFSVLGFFFFLAPPQVSESESYFYLSYWGDEIEIQSNLETVVLEDTCISITLLEPYDTIWYSDTNLSYLNETLDSFQVNVVYSTDSLNVQTYWNWYGSHTPRLNCRAKNTEYF